LYHNKHHSVDWANSLLVPAAVFSKTGTLKLDIRFDKCSVQRSDS
jgi:hypothetical protein